MRYPASEKVEIIKIVEQSPLSARKTLDQIGVPRATFYRWYDQYQTGGPEALEDRPAGSGTASLTPSGTGSSNSHWNNPICHPANWRCDLATHRATSYPKPRFIVS